MMASLTASRLLILQKARRCNEKSEGEEDEQRLCIHASFAPLSLLIIISISPTHMHSNCTTTINTYTEMSISVK
jgi:hypothetical protein